MGDLQNLLSEHPAKDAFAHFPAEFGTRFVITVDTEEEFDWTAPLDAQNRAISHLEHIGAFQALCGDYGVCPVYLLDYPVAASARARDILMPYVDNSAAEIGVHLHPWVNPPFVRDPAERSGYPGNLAPEHEAAKFTELMAAIQKNFGQNPLMYRAGRYGLGPRTAQMLREAGIRIDSSVRPGFNYAKDGGPNYTYHPSAPYWTDAAHSLLELPLTTIYDGFLRRWGAGISAHMHRLPLLPALLARSKALNRITLSPEAVSIAEAKAGIDRAVASHVSVLVFAFHSPSLKPGCTPYVRNDTDLEQFYAWWRAIFDHLHARAIRPIRTEELLHSLAKNTK